MQPEHSVPAAAERLVPDDPVRALRAELDSLAAQVVASTAARRPADAHAAADRITEILAELAALAADGAAEGDPAGFRRTFSLTAVEPADRLRCCWHRCRWASAPFAPGGPVPSPVAQAARAHQLTHRPG